jgi:hypothetical protein
LWANFGILGLILYFAFLVYLGYRLVKAFQKKLPTAFVSLFILLALLGHSLTEETNFMGFISTNVVAIFTAVVPLTSEAYEPLYQKEQAEFKTNYLNRDPKSFVKPTLNAEEKLEIILRWLTSLVAIILGVSPMLAMNLPARFHFAYGGVLNEICGAVAFLLLPLVLVILPRLRKEKSWLWYSVILGSLVLGILLALVAPWAKAEVALEGVSLGLFAVCFAFLTLGRYLPSWKDIVRAYTMPLIALALILSLDFGLTYGLGAGTSRYLCLALMMLNLFLWWAPLLLVKTLAGRPWESLWDYVEEKFTFNCVKGRLKEDERFRKEKGVQR